MLYTFESRLTLSVEEEQLLQRDLVLWSSAYRKGFTFYGKKQDDSKLYYYLTSLHHVSATAKSLTNVITGQFSAQRELQKVHQKELQEKIFAFKKTLKELEKKAVKQAKN